MPDHDLEMLKAALVRRWPHPGGEKVLRYVDQFFDRKRNSTRIVAPVVGNHGTYRECPGLIWDTPLSEKRPGLYRVFQLHLAREEFGRSAFKVSDLALVQQ